MQKRRLLLNVNRHLNPDYNVSSKNRGEEDSATEDASQKKRCRRRGSSAVTK